MKTKYHPVFDTLFKKIGFVYEKCINLLFAVAVCFVYEKCNC